LDVSDSVFTMGHETLSSRRIIGEFESLGVLGIIV
jgi:hypothetical protein